MTAGKKKNPHRHHREEPEDIVEISTSASEPHTAGTQETAHTDEPDQLSKEELAAKLSQLEKEKSDIEQKREQAEKEKDEISDRLLRTMAEFDNYKKRVAREKKDLIDYGAERLAAELLPVADNFERALEQAYKAESVEPVIEGIEMILKQFIGALEKFNIVSFESVGEQFDPEKHEAMAQQEHDEYGENTVISEYQKGYTIHDKLLRAARVIVSKGKPEQSG